MSRILTLNAGSSSIKFALFQNGSAIAEQPLLRGQIDGLGTATAHIEIKGQSDGAPLPALPEGPSHRQALAALVPWLQDHGGGDITAVGHRVVHGGQYYAAPRVLDPSTLEVLRNLIPLAPLHQPHNLAGIDATTAALPQAPQIACFDTAFHRTQPELAQRFALPRQLTAEGLRRYGFHGLSYEYVADTLPRHLGPQAEGRVVVAHLGNGASMCAMAHRRSVASTMGFTAVDGLMMGTRTGALDPGVLLYLMENRGMDAAALTRLLYKESGLLGVSGISQDMRTLLASDQPEAREAVALFCYRAARELGSLAAALGGLDALVFTGGIGEHAAAVRAEICRLSAWLGIALDSAANETGETRISRPDSPASAWVLPTNEEWMIARHTADLI